MAPRSVQEGPRGLDSGRGSEVAEDLTLPVPVHLRRPLVDASGPSLLLGLSCRWAQVEAALLEWISFPGATILRVCRKQT
jgi:hypothetical protein